MAYHLLHLLNRFPIAIMYIAVVRAVPVLLPVSESSHAERSEATFKRARFSFQEKITWREPLRGGQAQPIEQEAADKLSIGGLRSSVGSASRGSGESSLRDPGHIERHIGVCPADQRGRSCQEVMRAEGY